MRLGVSVIICVFAGSLVLSVQHYASAGAKVSPWLFYPLATVAFSGLVATLMLMSKPWPPEAFSRRLLALMVCAYGGLFVGMWAQQLSGVGAAGASIWRVIVASLSFQGAGLILVARFLREHQIGWSDAFGLSHQRRMRWHWSAYLAWRGCSSRWQQWISAPRSVRSAGGVKC